MKKIIFAFALFIVFSLPFSVSAQGNCITDDLTVSQNDWSIIITGQYVSGQGFITPEGVSGVQIKKNLTNVEYFVVHLTTSGSVQVDIARTGGTYVENLTQNVTAPGGTVTYNTPYGDSEYSVWVTGSAVISAIDICAPEPTITPTPTETLTPTPTDTATPTPLYTPMPTDDGQIGAESAITIPYHFEAIVFGNSNLPPPLPTVDLISTDFINQIGSIALTLYNLFDQYQVIAIFMVLLLAMAVIFWLYSFVTKTPSSVALRATDMIGTAAQVSNAYGNYLDEKSTDLGDTADRIDDYAVKDEHMDSYTKNYQLGRAKSFRSEGERLKKQSDKFKNWGRGFNQGARAFRQAKKINPYK